MRIDHPLLTLFAAAATAAVASGCRQTGMAPVGAPVTQLPGGQPTLGGATMGNPQIPGLGPLGGWMSPAGTRVPPPGTGSYGTAAAAASAPIDAYGPQSFTPPPIAAAQYATSTPAPGNLTDLASQIKIPPQVQIPPQIQAAPQYPVSPVSGLDGPPIGSGVVQTGWSDPSPPPNPRSGGMNVIDLTGAPPPPGYVPSPAGFQPIPGPSATITSQPNPNSSDPQWQSPRR